MSHRFMIAVAALIVATSCGANRPDAQETDVPERTIEQVQEEHTERWLELPGVVGSGIGLCDDGAPCIRVFLAYPSPEAEEAIPDRVEGHRVELVVTGAFQPRPPPDSSIGPG